MTKRVKLLRLSFLLTVLMAWQLLYITKSENVNTGIGIQPPKWSLPSSLSLPLLATQRQRQQQQQQSERQIQMAATTTKTTTATKTTTKTTTTTTWNYVTDPNGFVHQYTSCLLNPKCHTVYLHIQKTGGTTMEEVLKKIHPGESYRSCCDDRVLKDFHHYPDDYCWNDFQSYQVSPSEFPNILKTCQDVFQKNNNHPNHYIQVLVSTREPIARTLSFILQQCNRNPERRTKEFLQACDRCDFESDKELWLQIANRTNQEYDQIHHFLATRSIISIPTATATTTTTTTTATTTTTTAANDKKHELHQFPRMPVLSIDLVDLTSFLQQLKAALPWNLRNRYPTNHNHNEEITDRCDFQLSSGMIKALSASVKTYRNLTLGVHEQEQEQEQQQQQQQQQKLTNG